MAKGKLLLQLFWSFFKIGPSSFGGGYAMMPAIEREVVAKRGWFAEDEMADMLSLAGTAPGGVAVNAAAFAGYRKAGIAGSVAAVAGMTLPTFIIVVLLSLMFLTLKDNSKVQAALKGIRAAVVALILLAAYRMAKVSVFDAATGVATAAALLTLLIFGVNPLFVIVAGMIAGIFIIKGKEWMGLPIRTEKQRAGFTSNGALEPEYFI